MIVEVYDEHGERLFVRTLENHLRVTPAGEFVCEVCGDFLLEGTIARVCYTSDDGDAVLFDARCDGPHLAVGDHLALQLVLGVAELGEQRVTVADLR